MGLRGPGKGEDTDPNHGGKRRPSKKEQAGAAVEIVQSDTDIFMPVKPARLSKKASVNWDQLLPKLLEADMVCSLDEELLADYCEALAKKNELQALLNKSGWYTKQTGSNKALRPEVKLLERMLKECSRLADVLGLTPKARKGMGKVIKPNGGKKDQSEERKRKLALLKR